MSRGSKQGHAASGTRTDPPAVRIWFIATEKDSPDQDLLRAATEDGSKQRGWQFSMRRSRRQRVLGGQEKDRPYRLLDPRDARDVYQDAHVRDCLIISTHACHVKANASKDPATHRELLRLHEFVAYKAGFALVRGVEDVKQALGRFGTGWPPADGCAGHHDPRALPLHVFDPEYVWLRLDLAEERVAFDRYYQLRAGTRSDGSERQWQQPNAHHGSAGQQRSAMRVAGVSLAQGYHWDVQRGRGKARVLTESEVWLLDRQSAYLNVYPNGYIRGERKYGARRVWP